MTRAEQIRQALELLQPRRAERDACRKDIVQALDSMARTAARTKADKFTRESKKLWQSHNRQLERLIVASNRLKAAGWQPPIDHLLARLTELEAKEAKETKIPARPPVDLQRTLIFSRQWLSGYILPPRSAALLQKHSVTLAHALLKRRGGRRAIAKTRGGSWSKLAAILYGKRAGEPGADLFRHMQNFRLADD
jgi:hypothetical protein